jgi:hypothetical protein
MNGGHEAYKPNLGTAAGAGVTVGFMSGDDGIRGFPNGFRNEASGHFGMGRPVG